MSLFGAKAGAGTPAGLPRPGVVGVLDIGTSKVVCFIARPDQSAHGTIKVAGVGHQSAQGVRAGTIVDLEAIERAVRSAIDQAETMAGVSIDAVTINYGGPSLQTTRHRAVISVPGREIRDHDVKKVVRLAQAAWKEPERAIIHTMALRYAVDGNHDVQDPRGMFSTQLGVEVCVISAQRAPLRNLVLVADRCRLNLKSIVAAPYTAGLAALVDDDIHLGAIVVDMGAGATSYAVFAQGNLIHLGVVPLGGQHITNDIARGLSTPTAAAERIKTMYGTVLDSPDDDREMIDCPDSYNDPGVDNERASRAVLTSVIRPRVEETLEMLRDRLAADGLLRETGSRVVLVGGASQLDGVRELAARILGKQVKLGRPLRLSGLGDAVNGAGFASAAGALHHVIAGPREVHAHTSPIHAERVRAHGEDGLGPVQRTLAWLRENF